MVEKKIVGKFDKAIKNAMEKAARKHTHETAKNRLYTKIKGDDAKLRVRLNENGEPEKIVNMGDLFAKFSKDSGKKVA